MARPVTVNKSNYFIFGGQYALLNDEFIKNTFLPDVRFKNILLLDDERYNELMSFVFQKILDKMSSSKDLKKHLWFSSFTSNPDFENLKNILNTKKTLKINKGEIFLTQLSSQVFWHALHEIKEGKDVQNLFKNKWFEVLFEFYDKEMPNYREKYTEVLNPEWLKISDGFIEDVSLLIIGYEYYLQHKNGEKSERQLCEHIEAAVINKVLNVRQDYQVYERFFDEMGSAIGQTIDNKFKLAYLKSCYNPYLTV